MNGLIASRPKAIEFERFTPLDSWMRRRLPV